MCRSFTEFNTLLISHLNTVIIWYHVCCKNDSSVQISLIIFVCLHLDSTLLCEQINNIKLKIPVKIIICTKMLCSIPDLQSRSVQCTHRLHIPVVYDIIVIYVAQFVLTKCFCSSIQRRAMSKKPKESFSTFKRGGVIWCTIF